MAILDIREIMRILPHRYPMLLIDRILELEPMKFARGIKNVTANEPMFTGHFPGNPVLPGVYMIEALAQLGGTVILEPGDIARKVPYLAGIDKAKFRRPVVPGDTLYVHVAKQRNRGSVWKFVGQAKVDGKLVAEATYSAMLMDA